MTKYRLPVLAGLFCLLLMGFAVTSYGAIRFDVIPSPTEVINTGRSEVLGSVNLIVRGTGNVSGTSAGGHAQIGLLYTNPAIQIDNTTTSGIKIFYSNAFCTASPTIVVVQNIDINGKCSGSITVDLAAGAQVADTVDFIRLEGVRGRVDASGVGLTPGTDFYVDLQSINDPTANTFNPDRVRVAKSFDGMNVAINPATLLLCFPTLGTYAADPAYYIRITESFARAFVDNDAGAAGVGAEDRVDSGMNTTCSGTVSPAILGAPTVPTEFYVYMEQIPASVSGINWEGPYYDQQGTGSTLTLVSSTFSATAGTATALFRYDTPNQTGLSDITVEWYQLKPYVVLKANATQTGTVMVGVSLAPTVSEASGCTQPSSSVSRPRFLLMYESDAVALGNPPSDALKPYATITRCNCFLLFTYVTSDSGYDTGLAIANTTGDVEVFGTSHAPDQFGKITFYFYDKTAGYVGQYTTTADTLVGRSYVNVLSAILPLVTPSPLASFSGYIIAQTQFQFCHGFAFIADTRFASIAHGYVANVIPDPSIIGIRWPSDAGWPFGLPLGESLNN